MSYIRCPQGHYVDTTDIGDEGTFECKDCTITYLQQRLVERVSSPRSQLTPEQVKHIWGKVIKARAERLGISEEEAVSPRSAEADYTVSYDFLHQLWQAVGGVPQGVDTIQQGCYAKCRDAYIALNRLFDRRTEAALSGSAVEEPQAKNYYEAADGRRQCLIASHKTGCKCFEDAPEPLCANPECGHGKRSHKFENTQRGDICRNCRCNQWLEPEPAPAQKEEKRQERK